MSMEVYQIDRKTNRDAEAGTKVMEGGKQGEQKVKLKPFFWINVKFSVLDLQKNHKGNTESFHIFHTQLTLLLIY